jgi:carbon starvation protein
MSLSLLAIGVLALLTVAYFAYGSFIARQYRLDDSRVTPAVTKNDGVDFVPTQPFYLLAQHFSAIAAAGPIAGPILACMAFGWLPCVLWIGLGVVFIGAVHDLSALIASIRHGSHSIADVARQNIGRKAYLALTAFIWVALIYVIIAFTQITADSFVGKAEELQGLNTTFNKGGAVAASSALYLLLAVVMGIVQRTLKPPMWLVTVIFVPLTLGCVYAGTRLDSILDFPIRTWFVVILAYCFVASMLPMWALQQPRGYLGGFVLYMALGVGVLGVLFGGFAINQPMVTDNAQRLLDPFAKLVESAPGAPTPITSMIFPFLFVTIACGACSGFHGLICGGTTSKQIAKESHCKPVGFGAMLMEGFVALIALATVMMLTPEQAKGQPAARIYGDGLASFLTVFMGKDAFVFAATFGAMAFSTFVFDTLDVSTRLGRYLLQELFGAPGKAAGLIAAGLTAGLPLLILMTSDPSAYRLFWTLFGTSNQLLAGLTLLGITVWLYKSGKRYWYTLIPMVFIMGVTLVALVIQVYLGVRDASGGLWRIPPGDLNPAVLNAAVSIVLLALAVFFVAQAIGAVRRVGTRDA